MKNKIITYYWLINISICILIIYNIYINLITEEGYTDMKDNDKIINNVIQYETEKYESLFGKKKDFETYLSKCESILYTLSKAIL
jgi:hypothetical protein